VSLPERSAGTGSLNHTVRYLRLSVLCPAVVVLDNVTGLSAQDAAGRQQGRDSSAQP
jgi:hypothetical protein